MFRRSKTETAPEPTPAKVGGKGRPTPTRREAEALARAKARAPRDRKEASRRQRELRTESSQQMRAAMKTGDERYLPARDKGPVKRFVRDFVDARFSIVELMIPILVGAMILQYTGRTNLAATGTVVMFTTLLLVVLDMVLLRFRVRREVVRRFGADETKGTTYYAITRSMQMRFMRLPKTQVKIGQELPEHYR